MGARGRFKIVIMFRMSLPSNASLDYYPNNTPSNFTVKPVQAFSNPDYECALAEIIFPNRLINVRPNANTVVIRRIRKKQTDSSSIKATLIIPPGYYDTIDKLIEAIWEAGLKRYVSRTRVNKSLVTTKKLIMIHYDAVESKVTVRTLNQFAVQFGIDIARLLGFPVSYEGVWNGNYSSIIEGVKKSDFHATPSAGLNTLYVYTDIIKEQFVGGTSAPLLRIINMDQKTNNEDYTTKTFQRLYFAPLKTSHFDTINIRIYDDTGELINFEYGKIVVILEFQKISKAI